MFLPTRSWAKIGAPVSKKPIIQNIQINGLKISKAKNEKTISKNRIIDYFILKDSKVLNNPSLAVMGSGLPIAFSNLALDTG